MEEFAKVFGFAIEHGAAKDLLAHAQAAVNRLSIEELLAARRRELVADSASVRPLRLERHLIEVRRLVLHSFFVDAEAVLRQCATRTDYLTQSQILTKLGGFSWQQVTRLFDMALHSLPNETRAALGEREHTHHEVMLEVLAQLFLKMTEERAAFLLIVAEELTRDRCLDPETLRKLRYRLGAVKASVEELREQVKNSRYVELRRQVLERNREERETQRKTLAELLRN